MKDKIGWTIIVCSTLLIVLSFYILACGYVEYSFSLFLLSVIVFIIGIVFIKRAGNPTNSYYKELDEILNKYKTILKKTKNLPTYDNNEVTINFKNMEDLVDIQEKNNNPIFYKKENDKCTFMINNEEETFIYIKKLNKEENNIKNEVDKKEEIIEKEETTSKKKKSKEEKDNKKEEIIEKEKITSKRKNSKEQKENKKEEKDNKKDNKSKKYEIEILD